MKNTQLFIALTLILISGNLFGKQVINWIEVNYPPAYILDGEMKDRGFSQESLKLFIEQMPNYSHKKIEMNTNRLVQSLGSKEKIYCTPALGVRVNQFPNALYSKIVVVAPPAGIVIRKKDYEKFQNSGGISVDKLLSDTNYKMGIIDSGLFGSRINRLVFGKHKNNPKIFKRAEVDQKVFYQMLLANRVDYVIDYAFSYYTVAKKFSNDIRDKFQFLPIVEVDPAQKGYAICNNLPSSQDVINKINDVIKDKGYKKTITSSLISFLPRKMRHEYQQQNRQQIGK